MSRLTKISRARVNLATPLFLDGHYIDSGGHTTHLAMQQTV